MVGCSIRNCKSRSEKGGTLRFFSIPKDETVAKEWLRYCGPKTTTKNGRVCSNHFVSSDYFKSLQHILLNESPRKVRQLKQDAVPTLQLQIDDIDPQDICYVSIDIPSETVDTSGNMNCFPEECSSTPLNEFAGSSKVVDESDDNITISLAKHKQLQKAANKFNILKQNLEKIFTSGQIRCLMTPNMRRVRWSAEDIAAAISLRNISPKCYHYLRATVGIPLPGSGTLRQWAPKFEIKEGE